MKKTFLVSGLKPAYGKAVNDFVAAVDLGVGAFVNCSLECCLALADDMPQESLEGLPKMLKLSFEDAGGWKNVTIKEIK